MNIHNYIMPMNIGNFTHTWNNMTFPEYTTNTRSYTMTYTDHYQWLYFNIRSLPTGVGISPTVVLCPPFVQLLGMHSKYTVVSYELNRSLLATLYASHTIIGALPTVVFARLMCNTSECTQNTRSCTMN